MRRPGVTQMSKVKMSIAIAFLLVALLLVFRGQIFIYLFLRPPQIPANVTKLPLPRLDEARQAELTQYYENNLATPEEYILATFRNHDLVFVGEYHRISHDPKLIQRMIPLLYENGIFNLGLEFACHKDQALIDSVLTSKSYDESRVNRILFDFAIYWGYQEYADIFRSAWKVNRDLADSAKKFRIVGLNVYTDWSYIKTKADRSNVDVLRKVYADGDRDSFMANVILDEFVSTGQEALIYSGLHHAFTRYRLSSHDSKKEESETLMDKMGNLVYRVIGDKAFTIILHHPWASGYSNGSELVYPIDGILDAFVEQGITKSKPFGFDTRGTPFGALSANSSVYRRSDSDLRLEELCDGYIFQKPFSLYEGVTPIEGFINSQNFLQALQQMENPEANIWLLKLLGPEVLERVLTKEAGLIAFQFRKLH